MKLQSKNLKHQGIRHGVAIHILEDDSSSFVMFLKVVNKMMCQISPKWATVI